MKAKPTIILLVFLVMAFFAAEITFAYPGASSFPGSRSYTSSRQVVHTVQKDESLWTIAKQFDVDFTSLAEINGLNNPDLIFPGNKLIIKIQVDGSIMVMDNEEPANGSLPFNYIPPQVIAQVTYPDKDDVFAPANPVVSYEVKEAVVKPVSKRFKKPLIFKTFEKFVRWLSGSLGYSSDMTQARGQASFDPPTGPTYLHSNTIDANGLLKNIGVVTLLLNRFSSHIQDTSSPPPKLL